jgi:hypothetical protein
MFFPADLGRHVWRLHPRVDCVGDLIDTQSEIAINCNLLPKAQLRKGILPQISKYTRGGYFLTLGCNLLSKRRVLSEYLGSSSRESIFENVQRRRGRIGLDRLGKGAQKPGARSRGHPDSIRGPGVATGNGRRK